MKKNITVSENKRVCMSKIFEGNADNEFGAQGNGKILF